MAQNGTTKKRQARFLRALEEAVSICDACNLAKVPRRTVYNWRQDPEFESELQAACDIGTDALEDEAIRRAEKGWLEPVWHRGEEVGHVRKYSDSLLIFLLKGRRPEKYAERRIVDHNVKYADPYEELDRRYAGLAAAGAKKGTARRVN